MDWPASVVRVFVVAGIIVSFYVSVRLVIWLVVKISSIKLFLELRRELEPRHKPPPGQAVNRRRTARRCSCAA